MYTKPLGLTFKGSSTLRISCTKYGVLRTLGMSIEHISPLRQLVPRLPCLHNSPRADDLRSTTGPREWLINPSHMCQESHFWGGLGIDVWLHLYVRTTTIYCTCTSTSHYRIWTAHHGNCRLEEKAGLHGSTVGHSVPVGLFFRWLISGS